MDRDDTSNGRSADEDRELEGRVLAAVKKHGVTRVSKVLRLSAETTCRLAAGLPTHEGTRVLARLHAPRLAELHG